MKMFTDPTFYVPLVWSFVGFAIWILKTWQDPTDDTISGTLGPAIKKHNRTLLLSLLSCVGLCVILFEASALTKVAAFACGYMNQSLWQAAMDTVAAKINFGGGK